MRNWYLRVANSYWRTFLLCTLFFAIPAICHAWSGKVVHVADGDTITVQRDGNKVKVRLYGIDTPEKSQRLGVTSAVDCFALKRDMSRLLK